MKFIVLFLPLILMGCSTINISIPEDEKIVNSFMEKELTKDYLIKDQKIKNWWGQFNNLVLLNLIEEAEKNSPTIDDAIINIKNTENILVNNMAKNIPTVNFYGNVEKNKIYNETSNYLSLGIQTSWELDLLGKNELIKNANKLQVKNAKAMWYEAKTLIAAETARNYFAYKFCMKSLSTLNDDLDSRKKQNEITKLKINAGFEAESSLFQNNAGLSQAEANILNQESQCKIILKSLVSITAIDENKIKIMLGNDMSEPYRFKLFVPVSIPGNLIYQRPDVFNSMNNVNIMSYNLTKTKMDAFPTISISGNITKTITQFSSTTLDGNNWSIGPLTITIPIFDAGIRKANEELIESKYNQTKKQFSQDIRNAIKEVEVALINLSNSHNKLELIDNSVNNYKKAYESSMEKYKAGIIGLYEVESVRLSLLNELNAKINNEYLKVNSWIDLYKAVGGDFNNENN